MSVNEISMNVRGIPMLKQRAARHSRPRSMWVAIAGLALGALAWF